MTKYYGIITNNINIYFHHSRHPIIYFYTIILGEPPYFYVIIFKQNQTKIINFTSGMEKFIDRS